MKNEIVKDQQMVQQGWDKIIKDQRMTQNFYRRTNQMNEFPNIAIMKVWRPGMM